MSERLNDVDPVPSSVYPSLQPVTTPHPAMPRAEGFDTSDLKEAKALLEDLA